MASFDFSNLKIAIKSSDVIQTVEAYRLLSSKTDFPLHVGITEAGGLYSGIVKSAVGIGMILSGGIGDTIRVSLTRDPVEEVRVGFEILKAFGAAWHTLTQIWWIVLPVVFYFIFKLLCKCTKASSQLPLYQQTIPRLFKTLDKLYLSFIPSNTNLLRL